MSAALENSKRYDRNTTLLPQRLASKCVVYYDILEWSRKGSKRREVIWALQCGWALATWKGGNNKSQGSMWTQETTCLRTARYRADVKKQLGIKLGRCYNFHKLGKRNPIWRKIVGIIRSCQFKIPGIGFKLEMAYLGLKTSSQPDSSISISLPLVSRFSLFPGYKPASPTSKSKRWEQLSDKCNRRPTKLSFPEAPARTPVGLTRLALHQSL